MKRMLSLLLACIMVLGMFGIIPAAAEETSGYCAGDIELFTSFSDYAGVFGGDNYTLPDGFINIDNGRVKNVGVKKFESDTRTSNVVKMGQDSEPVLPFGTNFLDGYMHVSFDYLQTNENPDTTTGRNLRVFFARNATNTASTNVYADLNGEITVPETGTTWNANEYDYTKLLKGQTMELMISGSKEAGIARALFHNGKRLIGLTDTEGTVDDAAATAEDTWYKVDMFFDRDTCNYYVYIDGELQDYNYALDSSNNFTETELDTTCNFNSGGNRAIKGLIFRCDHLRANNSETAANSGNTNGYVYLDNVYVSQYTANHCTNDVLKITADTQGEIMKNGSKLNIGFSEYLTTAPTKENISITKDGKAFTGFSVTSDNAQATITFTEELEGGVYEVAVTGVTGKMSQSSVSNTVEFTATGTGTAADSTNYYWADEDFNNFEEGVVLPNWYYGNLDTSVGDTYNRYFMGEASSNYSTYVKKTTGADGSAAMELSADSTTASNDMYYFFPRGVASGEFKAEFDIKHANGGWTFGFVNYDDYNTIYNRNKYGRLQSNTGTSSAAAVIQANTMPDWQVSDFTEYKMQSSILLGMAKNGYTTQDTGADDPANRAFSPYLGMIGQENTLTNNNRLTDVNNLTKQLVDSSETDYMTLSADVWSKVEINVNDNSKAYTITVTPYNADGTLNTSAAMTTTWTDTDKNRYFKGVMGLRFTRNAYSTADLATYSAEQTGSVSIDNVKVYKTATSYLNEDFDDYTATGTGTTAKILPSGWVSFDNNMLWEMRYTANPKTVTGVTAGNGKNYNESSNPNDKSMLMYYKTPAIYKTLDKPVPAGEPFIMEFDVYNVGTSDTATNENPWMFMQMGKDDTHQLIGYNYAKGISRNGKVFVAQVTDTAEGSDAITNLIDDDVINGYLPFASVTDDETGETTEYTVEDTYARINGNSMRMNVVFGRPSAASNFNYSEMGRFDAKRAFHGSQNERVSTLVDVIGAWTNYKVLCEPVSASETKYTITQTKADGTTTTASFTNTRDWYTQDTYAIGFAIPFKNASKGNTSDGTVGTMFDNVKVYAADSEGTAISNVTNNYIAKITASNSIEEKDITKENTIPVGTTSLDITFSAPINEKLNPQLPARDESLPEVRNDYESTSNAKYKGTFTGYFDTTDNCYTDYTSVLDSIKDVISLRKLGSQLETGYTITLSEDKKTVTLTFAEGMNTDDKYTLGVSRNIAFEGDGYANIGDNFVQTYTVSGGFSDEDINFTKLNVTVFRGTADIPIDKAGALTTGETVTTSIDYENTGNDSVQALVGYAFYDEDTAANTRMISQINSEVLNIEANSKGTRDHLTFTVPEDHDLFKAFSWSYPGMQPYVDVIETK